MPIGNNTIPPTLASFREWVETHLTQEELDTEGFFDIYNAYTRYSPVQGTNTLAEYGAARGVTQALAAYHSQNPTIRIPYFHNLENTFNTRIQSILQHAAPLPHPFEGLAPAQVVPLVNTLLVDHAQRPDNPEIATLLRNATDTVLDLYQRGRLSAAAQTVVQVEFQRMSLALESGSRPQDPGATDTPLFLSPAQAAFILEEWRLQPAPHSHGTYALSLPVPDRPGENGPVLDQATRQSLIRILEEWAGAASTLDPSPYTRLVNRLTPREGEPGQGSEEEIPWITLTRDSQGRVVGLGLALDSPDRILLDTVVVTPSTDTGPGGDATQRHTLLAMVEAGRNRAPEIPMEAVVNQTARQPLLQSLYFSPHSHPQLFSDPGGDSGPTSFQTAQQSLIFQRLESLQGIPNPSFEFLTRISDLIYFLRTSNTPSLPQALTAIETLVQSLDSPPSQNSRTAIGTFIQTIDNLVGKDSVTIPGPVAQEQLFADALAPTQEIRAALAHVRESLIRYEGLRNIQNIDEYTAAWDLSRHTRGLVNAVRDRNRRVPGDNGLAPWLENLTLMEDRIQGRLEQLTDPIPKKLHLLSLGDPDPDLYQSLTTWTNMNPDHQITLWYDPDAVLADYLKQTLRGWAYATADTDAPEGSEELIHEIDNRLILLQNQAWENIRRSMEGGQSFDEGAMAYLVEHLEQERDHLEVLRQSKLAGYRELVSRIASQYPDTPVALGDVKTTMTSSPFPKTLDLYYRELGLRNIPEAASNIARLEILRREGGIYLDADVVPAFAPSQAILDAFQAQVEELARRAYGDILHQESKLPDGFRKIVTRRSQLLGNFETIAWAKINQILLRNHPLADHPVLTRALARANEKTVMLDVLKRNGLGTILLGADVYQRTHPGQSPFKGVHGIHLAPDAVQMGISGEADPVNSILISHGDATLVRAMITSVVQRYQQLDALGMVDIDTIERVGEFTAPDTLPSDLAEHLSQYRLDGILGTTATQSLSGPEVLIEGVNHRIASHLTGPRDILDFITPPEAYQFFDPQALTDLPVTWIDTFEQMPEGIYAEESRYPHTLVIRLDNALESIHTARYLFRKHQETATLLYANEDPAELRFASGTLPDDFNGIRITLVGVAETQDDVTTLGGYEPHQLAQLITRDLETGPAVIERITLVAEEMALGEGSGRTAANRFAVPLMEELTRNGMEVNSVAFRNTAVDVNPFGRKTAIQWVEDHWAKVPATTPTKWIVWRDGHDRIRVEPPQNYELLRRIHRLSRSEADFHQAVTRTLSRHGITDYSVPELMLAYREWVQIAQTRGGAEFGALETLHLQIKALLVQAGGTDPFLGELNRTIHAYKLSLMQTLPNRIHMVWIGKLGQTQEAYLRQWVRTNGTENEINLWYDPQALLAKVLSNAIAQAVELELGTQEFSSREQREQVRIQRTLTFQNRAHAFIHPRTIRGTAFDEAAIQFMINSLGRDQEELVALRRRHLASFTQAVERLRADFPQARLRLRDLGEIYSRPSANGELYHQELSLRGHLASASDISRVEIIRRYGGIYYDMDILPPTNPNLFREFETEIAEAIAHMTKEAQEEFPDAKPHSLQQDVELQFNEVAAHIVQLILQERGEETLFSTRGADKLTQVELLLKGSRFETLISRMEFRAREFEGPLLIPIQPFPIIPDSFIMGPSTKAHFTDMGIFGGRANSAYLNNFSRDIARNYEIMRSSGAQAIQGPGDLVRVQNALTRIIASRDLSPERYREIASYRLDTLVEHSRGSVYMTSTEAALNSLMQSAQHQYHGNTHLIREQLFLPSQPIGTPGTAESETSSWAVGGEPVDIRALPMFQETSRPKLILQLEEDPVTTQSARFLYNKHPESSQWVVLRGGGLETMAGDPVTLDHTSRLVLVGHGTETAIAGMSPSQIMEHLLELGILSSGSDIRRISLVACTGDDFSTPQREGEPAAPFAEALLQEAVRAGVNVGSITSRTALVRVDSRGRKWVGVPDDQGRVIWTRNNPAYKLIVSLGEDRQPLTRVAPVEEGLVQIIGTRTDALGPLGNGTFYFKNGIQTDGHGTPLPESDRLQPDQLATVREILGESPNGEVRIRDGQYTLIQPRPSGEAALPHAPEFEQAVKQVLSRYGIEESAAADLLDAYRRWDALRGRGNGAEYGALEALNNEFSTFMDDFGPTPHPQLDPLPQALHSYQQTLMVEIPRRLHFIWIGGLGDIQEAYLRQWARVNGSENEINLWYDPHAVLAKVLAKAVTDEVEARLSREGISDSELEEARISRTLALQDRVHAAITRDMAGGMDFDQAAAAFMVDALGRDRQALEALRRDHLSSFTRAIERINAEFPNARVRLRDLNQIYNQADSNGEFYHQELSLRNFLASAADVSRVEVVRREGGIYLDIDMLPPMNPELFHPLENQIQQAQVYLTQEHVRRFPNQHPLDLKKQVHDLFTQARAQAVQQALERRGENTLFIADAPNRLAQLNRELGGTRFENLATRMEFQAREFTGSLLIPTRAQPIIPDSFIMGPTTINTFTDFGIIGAQADSAYLNALSRDIRRNYTVMRESGAQDIHSTEALVGVQDRLTRILHERGMDQDNYADISHYRLDRLMEDSFALVAISSTQAAEDSQLHSALQDFGSDTNPIPDQMVRSSQGIAMHGTDVFGISSWTRGEPETGITLYEPISRPQIILQVDTDPVAQQSARFLFNKHPEGSQWMVHRNGRLETRAGDPVSLGPTSRLGLVGHGTATTIGGMGPSQIMQLLLDHGLVRNGTSLGRISLVACNGDDFSTPALEGAPRAPFAQSLMEEAQRAGVTVDRISARTALVRVDSQGRKWTGVPDDQGQIIWSRKNKAYKLVVTREGETTTPPQVVPVEEGLVEIVGTRADALGPMEDGTHYFENGIQTDGNGTPLPESDQLPPDQMTTIQAILGETPNGEVRVVDGRYTLIQHPPRESVTEESNGSFPGLELPRDHIREQVRQRALDAVDMEAVLRRLPARVRDHGMTRQAVETMAEGAADAVNLQLEAQRDHMRLMKAVVDRIRTQNEETGGDWVLAPDSIDTDGDTLHFKVVRRSDVLSGGTAEQPEPLVRPGAESVRLGINIHGIIKTPGLLAARNRLAAKWLEKMRSVDPEGRLQAGIGGITFAGGLMLAGIGLLQAVRGLEEREDWQSVYGAASASYFAGHAAVGGLSKALSTQLGKRLVSGAQRLVTTATEAAVEGVARVTGRTAAEVGESLAKITTVAARSATTLAGVVGEIIPFVGVAVGLVMIGLDAYHLFEAKNDIERVQYGVDMVFDAAVTIIDLVGSAFPPAEIVTAPLSLVINVVRMIFDSAMVEVQAELAKLPADATDAQKALAVINGIGFGFRDFLRNLTPWAAVEDAKAIDKEHNQDLDYIHSLNDPATYFGIHPVTGVTGEAALDFQMGDNSMSGGDVVVRLGEPGANTRITIGDVPQDRLNNGEGELATHSLDWQGVLAANTDFVLLGFGESYTIQTTVAKAYLFWAIPVHSQTVISGTGANRDSRTGTYFGNSRDNTFVGPRRSDLADAPGDTQEVRDRKSDLRTALSTYHYYIHGGEGNDTFTVGGSVNHLYGDEGADTYIIQEQGYFYIHNQAADTALDTLVLDNTLLFQLGIEINPGRFSEGRNTLGINTTYYSDDTSSRYQLRETTLGQVVDFLESEAHRHLRIRTRDGYLIHLNGDRLAAQRDAGNYHYVLQSDDIRGIFVNGQQSPNFDARINGASVFHSGSIQPQRQGNRVEYTPGRFHNIRLNHIENIFGDDRYNSLGGNQLDNYIHGGGGNDFIYGYDGNDTLVGGAAGHGGPNIVQSILSGGRGKDTLISSPESSQLFGGQGADTYILDRGITQVLIRDVSDGELNLVQLPVVARHLVQTLAADGDLLLTDSAHPARQVRVDNWRDSDTLFEFHTADGWIYTRTGSNLGLTGFDGMTFAPAKADAALLSLPPSNGGFDLTVYDLPRGAARPTTQAQVDRVVRSGHRVASGHLSSLDFAGGDTPAIRFIQTRIADVRHFLLNHIPPDRFWDATAILPTNDMALLTTTVRNLLGLPRPTGTGLDINDIRDHYRDQGITLPADLIQRMDNGTPPLVNQFLNQPNLTTGSRTVTSAGLLKFTTHIWLDQGRHEFRLTSSMNSLLRINGGTVIGMGAGTVHQGGNTLAKNGHITVETPGFFTLEVFYSGQGTDDTAADGDNEHRDSSLPEHYFRLEKENGQGEFHVLGTGDTDTLVRNLADLPNAHLRGDQGLVFDATRSEYAAIERIIGSNDDDLLSGNALDNQIFGSGGSDTMTGWNGSDVYHVDGQGLDIIRNIAGDGLMDNVYLPGTRANLTFAIVDNRHLEVRSSGTPIARVEDWALSEAHRHIQFHTREGIILGVAPATSDDGDITVQTFVAAMDFGQRETGVTFNAGSDTDFPQLHSIMGSEFDDTLTGNDQDNQISAEKGNNHLRGMGGNDILYAGTGSDILEGGEGRDSYVVTLAAQTVTLRNAQAGEEQNILRLHADKGQIRLSREGDDLIIQGARFGQGTVRVVVEDWYIDPSVRNLAVATDDDWFFTIDGDPPTIQNKELNFATETRGQVIDLTRSGIYGTDTARVNGSPFADTIMGNALDNLIIGGGGADHLTGGAGADVYVVGANAGEVTIDNRTRDNARDVILLSMAADRIDRTQASGDDLLIRTHAGTTLRLLGWQTQAQARDITLMVEGQSFSLDPAGRFVLESVDFSGQDAGIIHTLRQGATALSGSASTDELTGNPGDNHLTGGLGGMDRLTGLDGSDIYDVHLPVNTAGDQALTPTEVEAPGGRIITIANGARDNAMDRILARGWTREQVRTRRHGNDLLLYAVDGPGDLTGAALPLYGIRVENWFIDASARHLALELPNEGTVIQITDAGNLGPIIGIDDSAMTPGQTRDLTTPSHGSVLRITDSDFDDTYTGNSADDLFISRGGNDRLVGGNGQDTFSISGIFSRTPRTITLRNGGDDGETDLVFLDMAAADLYFSRIRPDGFLEIQGAGLTLVLEDWDAGSADHPAFQLATREGITFGMDAHGRLSIVSVDISHGSAQTIDATAVFNPTREDARVVARHGAGALAVPGQLAQALILKGSPGSDRLLAGDGDNTLVSGGTGTEVEILSGGGGKDNYVLAAQGRYEIQNHDESKAMDTVQLDLNFNHIQGLRNQNDLELTSSFGFSLTIAGYFTSDAFRHLSFVTRDGIQFEISGPDLEVEDRTLVFKTIRGMDLSNATEDVTVDLGRVGTFTHARMGVTGFTGSKTFANQVTGGPLGTQVTTGGARDTITTQDGNDLIRSGGGDDRVTAGGGKDILFAGDGNDNLDGGAGDDVIVGNAGSDTINGGEGSDTLAFVGDALTQTGVNVNLALGRGEDADAQGDRYTNVENITATPFDDTLEGDEGINVLQAGDGDDALLGNGGTDILAPGAGTDRVDGGEGSDTVDYADLFLGIHVDLVQGTAFHLDGDYAPTGITDTLVSIENVRGTAFDDRILGNSEDNLVLGSMGRDRLDLGGGHDLVDYTDLVFAGDQGLWIDLGVQANWDLDALPQAQDQGYQVQWLAHVEEIHGSSSGDRIYGTDGNETLDGGAGIDELRGRGGDDLFLGHNDGDRIHGGDGNDTLDYSRLLAGITASLTTGRAGQDQLSHIENLSGSQFNDILEGDDNINRLSGSLGLDELSGLGGNDLFFGPGDGDLFMGGEGTDTVDFRNAAHGVSVTMGRTDFTEQERAAWEALTLRTDHLIGVEIVHGSAFSDLLSGSALSGETLHGGGGNDWFTGSLQGETLDQGRSPNPETLSPPPTPLRDTLNGGEGLDVVSYAQAQAGIYAHLGRGLAGGDRLVSIEGIEGSAFDDILLGSGADDLFFAGAGNDVIGGGEGNDTLDHRLLDTVDGITVTALAPDTDPTMSPDTAQDQILDPDGSSDPIPNSDQNNGPDQDAPQNQGLPHTYQSRFTDTTGTSHETRILDVETLMGTGHDDVFTGGDLADHFMGLGGDDIFTGGLGNDRLEGGDGDDTYTYTNGDGSDTLRDTAGNDQIQFSGLGRSDLAFWANGDDLLIGIGQETLTIEDGLIQAGAVETIALADGSTLTATATRQLVEAMAQFAADNGLEIQSAQDAAQNNALTSLAATAWSQGAA